MATLDPHSPLVLPPGGSLSLGVVHYEIAQGGLNQAYYAFRSLLDENGCRFPPGYDPPVHWNELYDNPEWSLATPGAPPGKRMTRPKTYTRSMLEEEAAKARDYRCESLYLDPGWDTDFGTLVWGEQWLGPRKDFVDAVREQYGLGISLHCPKTEGAWPIGLKNPSRWIYREMSLMARCVLDQSNTSTLLRKDLCPTVPTALRFLCSMETGGTADVGILTTGIRYPSLWKTKSKPALTWHREYTGSIRRYLSKCTI